MFWPPLLVIAEIHARQEQERLFEDSLKGMPHDLAASLRKAREEAREKARIEAIAELRHRELCEAIRATSFWRPFG